MAKGNCGGKTGYRERPKSDPRHPKGITGSIQGPTPMEISIVGNKNKKSPTNTVKPGYGKKK